MKEAPETGGFPEKQLSASRREQQSTPYPESLRPGIEILDRVPAGVSTVLAQSANYAGAMIGSESAVSG